LQIAIAFFNLMEIADDRFSLHRIYTIILTDAMNMSTSSPIVNSGMLNDQKTFFLQNLPVKSFPLHSCM